MMGRTLTTDGESTTTGAEASGTTAVAGPAAREARRRVAALVTDSGVSVGDSPVVELFVVNYACLGSNIRSTHVSAGLTLSLPPA